MTLNCRNNTGGNGLAANVADSEIKPQATRDKRSNNRLQRTALCAAAEPER
jgi:hypothetical protein